MFNSLKHWLASLDKENPLFEHAESEAIHIALASVLYHIISADHVEDNREVSQFAQIMKNEFSLSAQQIQQLYTHVKNLKSDSNSDLLTVNAYLKDNPNLCMTFMSKLNQLIAVDGVDNEEITIFYQAMEVVFPEITKQLINEE